MIHTFWDCCKENPECHKERIVEEMRAGRSHPARCERRESNSNMQIGAKRNRWAAASAAAVLVLATLSCQILNSPPLHFAPDAMPRARVGVFYFVIIKITNNQTPAGEFSITQGTLPGGLMFQRITGQDAVLVSGTPLEPGAFHFVVSVWCYGTNHTGQTGTKDYVLPVSP